MKIGTLIYLKNENMIYRYIIYRPDKKVYVLETIREITGYTDKYINIHEESYKNCAIIIKAKYKNIIEKTMTETLELIDKNNELKIDHTYNELKIQQLEKEISNIEKKENKTDNQLKSIKQLKKAVRRNQYKINAKNKQLEEEKVTKLRRYNEKIKTMNKILEYIDKI